MRASSFSIILKVGFSAVAFSLSLICNYSSHSLFISVRALIMSEMSDQCKFPVYCFRIVLLTRFLFLVLTLCGLVANVCEVSLVVVRFDRIFVKCWKFCYLGLVLVIINNFYLISIYELVKSYFSFKITEIGKWSL